MQLTENFTKKEFDSKDGAKMPDDVLKNIKVLAENLQVIRDRVGRLKINSGYRSPEHNASKEVGGVKYSQHVKGNASDLRPLDVSVDTLYKEIIKLINEGKIINGGVGIYNSFVHYDIKRGGRRWNNKK